MIVIEGAGSVDRAEPARARSRQPRPRDTRSARRGCSSPTSSAAACSDRSSGTAHLLSADERSLFRGFAINKFRGDMSLFDEGVRMLEERTASTCFGVFPYAADLHLDAEDSLALQTRPRTPRATGRAAGDRAFPARVERDRLPSADVGRLDHVAASRIATTSSCCLAARTPSPISPGSARHGLADWILEQHRARHDDHRDLRRLSDARTRDPRSGRDGIVRRSRRGTGTAFGSDRPQP